MVILRANKSNSQLCVFVGVERKRRKQELVNQSK